MLPSLCNGSLCGWRFHPSHPVGRWEGDFFARPRGWSCEVFSLTAQFRDVHTKDYSECGSIAILVVDWLVLWFAILREGEEEG